MVLKGLCTVKEGYVWVCCGGHGAWPAAAGQLLQVGRGCRASLGAGNAAAGALRVPYCLNVRDLHTTMHWNNVKGCVGAAAERVQHLTCSCWAGNIYMSPAQRRGCARAHPLGQHKAACRHRDEDACHAGRLE